jgi:hypothetical protein
MLAEPWGCANGMHAPWLVRRTHRDVLAPAAHYAGAFFEPPQVALKASPKISGPLGLGPGRWDTH